jgi:hypothetical protein
LDIDGTPGFIWWSASLVSILMMGLTFFVESYGLPDFFGQKSLYADYMNDHIKFLKKYLLNLKVPLKIRIFYVVPSQENSSY